MVYAVLPSAVTKASAIPNNIAFTELYHFSLAAYGLQSLCLRLIHVVTSINPRLDMGCIWFILSQQDFHLLEDRHVVAHIW